MSRRPRLSSFLYSHISIINATAANLVIGRRGVEKRIVYLIDYGMAREYAIWEEGYVRLRKQRDRVLMRGTTRFVDQINIMS